LTFIKEPFFRQPLLQLNEGELQGRPLLRLRIFNDQLVLAPSGRIPSPCRVGSTPYRSLP
jgi:hypothetical protein